jgi:hypothetical protein
MDFNALIPLTKKQKKKKQKKNKAINSAISSFHFPLCIFSSERLSVRYELIAVNYIPLRLPFRYFINDITRSLRK